MIKKIKDMSGASQICSGKNRQCIDWKSEINTDNKNPQLKERGLFISLLRSSAIFRSLPRKT
jgi:hypothetical protein